MSTAEDALPPEPPRRAEAFYELISSLRSDLVTGAESKAERLASLLRAAGTIRSTLESLPPQDGTRLDIEDQLRHLLYRGFLVEVPDTWQRHYARYLRAIETRLTKRRESPERESQRRADVAPLWNEFLDRFEETKIDPLVAADSMHLRFLMEELRVSVFAQELRTAVPVSPKRIKKAWEALLTS